MRIEKTWGYEEIIHNGDYCCKKLVYTKSFIKSSLHYHPKKHETFVIMSGTFAIYVEGHFENALGGYLPGYSVVIPPGTRHQVTCLEPGIILESSTHDDPEDCVRLIPSES